MAPVRHRTGRQINSYVRHGEGRYIAQLGELRAVHDVDQNGVLELEQKGGRKDGRNGAAGGGHEISSTDCHGERSCGKQVMRGTGRSVRR